MARMLRGLRMAMRSRHYTAGSFLCVAYAATAHASETIYIKPGQCVMVGAQQVCASSTDAAATAGDVTYACRYGEHRGGDLPGYKTYGLVKLNNQDGKVTETLIKDFGIKGKEKCDEAAADRKK